jgi:biopolymer transport protein ExbB
MSFSLFEIFHHMGVAAMIVAGILVIMGMASLTVFVERIIALRRSRTASRAFAAAVAEPMQAGDINGILTASDGYRDGHLARVVRAGLTTYWHATKTADISGLTPAERTRRHLERYMEEVGADLRRGLAVLASVGSVAPFVGLLGTVVGIITAFQGIASTGSGGLSSVSAGISEALVETALGLAVAIPAVLAYHYLTNEITRDEGALNRSAGELLDSIEDWAERDAQNGKRHEKVA